LHEGSHDPPPSRPTTSSAHPDRWQRPAASHTGRKADIVGFAGFTLRRGETEPDFSGFTAAGVEERVHLVREAAGDRYERIERSVLVQRVVVTDNRRQAAEELARRWTQLSPEEILQSPYVPLGTVDQLVEDLQARRQRWGISSYTIFEPYMDACAPIVSRLVGT
jgi:hypothetical protein